LQSFSTANLATSEITPPEVEKFRFKLDVQRALNRRAILLA
jgi:hypothetical protein